MENKKCFKCNKVKPVSEFYKHPEMSDGLLGKCKLCTRKDTKVREYKLRQNPDWIDKEKKRQRDKYYRLGYKDKHKPSTEERNRAMRKYKDKFPEKEKAKNISRRIDCPVNKERHHWSYNTAHAKDLIFLTNKEHNKLHRYITYDQERMMYRNLDGILLDTKEKHLEYYESIKNKD